MITFKVGILGAGSIAAKIADCLNGLSGFSAYAIASRDKEKAEAFKEEHNCEKAYGSYLELIQDPAVELVYIATVNSTHAELAKLCLENGKHCLVEKPFSYNSTTTREVLELAKEKNLFAGEALWTRYMPLTLQLQQLIKSNVIGQVRHMTANLGYDLHTKERLIKPEYAGGALLDLGIYPIAMILTVMGMLPASVASATTLMNTGVDAVDVVQMNFSNARSASMMVTMTYKSDNRAVVYGTHGRIEIDNVNCPETITVFGPDGEPLTPIKKPEKQQSGYEYQFIAARETIITGKNDTPEHAKSDIMAISSFMEMLRRSFKVVFPLPGEPKKEELEQQFKPV